jgi:hypothetical protein
LKERRISSSIEKRRRERSFMLIFRKEKGKKEDTCSWE